MRSCPVQAVWRHRRGVYHGDEVQGELSVGEIINNQADCQVILKEIDEEFTEDELDEIIAEVARKSYSF